jgi:threonine dehydratase
LIPTLSDIRKASRNLERIVLRTPVVPLKYSSPRRDLFLKLESLQYGGAFKIRGAYHKISSLGRKVRRTGIVTFSSGNHAQGAALAARMLGVRATVVMLDQSVPTKVEATRSYGAEVIFGGSTSVAIQTRAEAIARERGWEIVPPFDDPHIIAGQGSVGLEILRQLDGPSVVIVPIGGGGLISGIATAVKESRPQTKVYGVEPEGAAKVTASLKAGHLVTLPSTQTVADGLKPVRAGELTFPIIQRYVDDVVTVSDEEILDATRMLLFRERILAEPSGAATTAAVLSEKVKLPSRGRVCLVVSGGNADLPSLIPQLVKPQSS